MGPTSQRSINIWKKKFKAAADAGGGYTPTAQRISTSKPAWYFFYGTLTDPERLARIAGLNETPQMQEAKVEKSCIKYWGPYPVLCEGEDTIRGVVWYAPTAEIVERLREYESDAYHDATIRVHLKGGEEMTVHTFLWNGMQSDLLEQPFIM